MGRGMPEQYGGSDDPAGPDAAADPHAVPGLDPSESPNGSFAFHLDVDGERFAVFESDGGQWSYDWLTGPHPYGFAASGPPVRDLDEHRDRIRLFLRDIDPATGYLRDDPDEVDRSSSN